MVSLRPLGGVGGNEEAHVGAVDQAVVVEVSVVQRRSGGQWGALEQLVDAA